MEAPDEFRCPITMEVMTDPVIGEDGHTYERSAIIQALQTNSVSPMTRQRMTIGGLRPNFALRSTIQRWKSGPPTSSSSSSSKASTKAPPKPSAPPSHTHTEYILLITPEVQSEQERLFNKRPVVATTAATATTTAATATTTATAATAATSVTLDEHRRRMCRVSIILCLLVVVLIFVFHAMSS